MHVLDLLETYQVDQNHARSVADYALALFDGVTAHYDLSTDARRLLELSALLHNVGLTTDPPAHHLIGRDIMLRHTFDDLSPQEQTIVACVVVFHRKKVRRNREPAFLSLSKKRRKLALQLAAIVRVADGLDYSQSGTTNVLAVERCEAGVCLKLDGPHAAGDGARAVDKADLWQEVFGEPVSFSAPESNGSELQTENAEPEVLLAPWYAAGDAPLAELGRVLLRRNFRDLMDATGKVRANRTIKAIHNLRVATRRLRAAMALLEPVAPPAARKARKALKRIANQAGAVRDLDVLLDDMQQRIEREELPDEEFATLREHMQGARAKLHAALCDTLEGENFAAFVQDFAALMNDCSAWDNSLRVRDLAGSTIWKRYEELRRHDRNGLPADESEIHMMRIAGKRLRYSLELFADTFGERVAQVVNPLIAFQDHVGVLQDVVVATELLQHYANGDESRAAADAYLAVRAEQAAKLRAELPTRWDKVGNGTYRRNLMGLIVKL